MPIAIPKGDIKFLSFEVDKLLATCQDTDQEYDRFNKQTAHFALSPIPKNAWLLLSTLVSITGAYLRAKGLKRHPASKTEREHFMTEAIIMMQIFDEVKARPYLYPVLHKSIVQGTVDIDLDEILRQRSEGER